MIARFLKNTRISCVINQTQSEFHGLSQSERAYVVLMAADLLNETDKGAVEYGKIMRSPEEFTSDECYQVYWNLESFKAYQEKGLRRINTHLKSLGISNLPNHSKMMYFGLLFWLTRLGGLVNSKRKDNVKMIIENLIKNITVNDIDDALVEYENMVEIAKYSGGSDAGCDKNKLRKSTIELFERLQSK